MANDRTRDLAHQLREALGEHTSAQTEQVLRDLWRDDLARNELFSRLQDREREPLTRLWENYGPGRRLTHHPGPGFQARVRWQDTTTTMRRGAVRAALAREFGDAAAFAAGGVHASPLHAMPARRHAELAAQLEAAAPPLLEFARDAYRRGWAEETHAPDDIEKARALLRPFVEAFDQLSASLHDKLGGAWLNIDGWGGTSACGILHGLASALAHALERGQLPRDRPHLVGEGMSQVLVPAWWDRLRRHLQHELDMLAGRATEAIEHAAAPAKPRIPGKADLQILRAIEQDRAGRLVGWPAIAQFTGLSYDIVRHTGPRLLKAGMIERVDPAAADAASTPGARTRNGRRQRRPRGMPFRLLQKGREILSR